MHRESLPHLQGGATKDSLRGKSQRGIQAYSVLLTLVAIDHGMGYEALVLQYQLQVVQAVKREASFQTLICLLQRSFLQLLLAAPSVVQSWEGVGVLNSSTQSHEKYTHSCPPTVTEGLAECGDRHGARRGQFLA